MPQSSPPSYRRSAPGLAVVALLSAAFLGACAAPQVRGPETDQALYREVSDAVSLNNCPEARQALETLSKAHPRSFHLPNAYLEAAYACLRTGDIEAAEALSGEYLERFAGHSSEDYGYYLNALAAYARWRALPIATSGAQSAELAREAFGRFRELLVRHPDSGYGAEVRPVLLDLREGLARVELQAIREDLTASRFDEVIPRARYLLTHYGATDSAPYAMAALADAHEARGEEADARRLRQQLEADWPDHPVARETRNP